MALVKFQPDYDLFDPEDEDSWIGTWHHDDGSQVYGKGDPDMGRDLLAENDAQPADTWKGVPYDDPEREVADAPVRVGRAPNPAETGTAPNPSHAWQDDVPPEVARTLTEQATAAGLNPDQLARVIKSESGWNPASLNPDTKKHGGLIQFDRDLWPGVAAAAGQPDVTWDQMRQMSAAEQVPFVVAYYKDKGLTPESDEGDYHMATFMPAFAKESDDFVLGEKDSNEKRGNLRSGTIYAQNEQLDANKDGRITRGEVANRSRAANAPTRMNAAPQPGVTAQLGAGAPGSLGGMPLAEAQVRGVPLTPEQIQQRQQGIMDRTNQNVAAYQQGEELRRQGREQAFNYFTQQSEQQKQDALGEQQKHDQLRVQAQQKLDRELYAPIQKVDPKRLFANMTSGQKVMAAIGVALSAIGQAANSMLGIQSGNTALQVLESQIQSDIDAQKEEIAQGRASRENRVAYWSRVLGNAESGAAAARQEARQAAANMAQARAQNAQMGAEQKANIMQKSQEILGAGQQDAQLIADRENERMTLAYQQPKPSADGGAQKALETIQSLKMITQELKASGKSDAQIDAFFRANGLARVDQAGVPGSAETVPQQQTREKEERGADEETSKELEPIALGENAVRDTLAKLDALQNHALISEDYSEPGEMSGNRYVPGVPTPEEVNAFNQSLEDLVLKAGKAISGSDMTPEIAAQIRQTIVGGGTISDIRQGLQRQLQELQEKRRIVSARRGGAASRIGAREQGDQMPLVTGRVGVP